MVNHAYKDYQKSSKSSFIKQKLSKNHRLNYIVKWIQQRDSKINPKVVFSKDFIFFCKAVITAIRKRWFTDNDNRVYGQIGKEYRHRGAAA